MGSTYFELRAIVPLFAYLIYWRFGKYAKPWMAYASMGVYLLCAGALIYGMKTGVVLSTVVGSSLSYESAIEAMVFGFLVVFTLRDKAALALIASVLALSCVGWLYEVSFWTPIQMWINPMRLSAPLMVNTQIISLILLTYTLRRERWKPQHLTLIAFTIYAASSIYLATTYPHYYLPLSEIRRWYIRVPAYTLIYAAVWETNLSPQPEAKPWEKC